MSLLCTTGLEGISCFQGLIPVSLRLQEALRHHIGDPLPAAVRPGRVLPVPALHRRHLCGSEVRLRLLRPRQEDRLPEHHGEDARAAVACRDLKGGRFKSHLLDLHLQSR